MVVERTPAAALGRALLGRRSLRGRLPLLVRLPQLPSVDHGLPPLQAHPARPRGHKRGGAMTQTLAGANIRGYYAALGIQIPGWARTEASIRCFAGADAHQRGDRDPSCSVNLEHGAWHCHACGAKGGAFDAATARGYSDRGAIDLMVAYGLTEHSAYRHANANRRPH